MCGIAGIVRFPSTPPLERAPLQAMSAAIAHRGPDGSGQYIDPRGHAALLHRRLAIIDQPCGAQPMPNEDGTVQVVFNGEIYNHAELRRELQAAGHTFRTDHSDTEVLVHGWEQWGAELPSKLRGMFAFAIWDARANTLFLARDRMGQKPLFYASLEDGIVFGSTIPSVLAWPEVPRRVPREQLALYLQLGYFPPPHTPFRDISQLMPGHWLRLRGEVLDGNRYWSPFPSPLPSLLHPDSPSFPSPSPSPSHSHSHSASSNSAASDFKSQISDFKSQISNLKSHLTAAVESQLISDVPIACFLSGGIDSSIIALLMQNAARAAGAPPIHTVSVGFAESSFDETRHAAAVAAHIGSRHTRLEVNAAQDVIETLQLLMQKSLGQPFADSSILPTYHLSKAVRDIAHVALAGDGGDELFAGYDRYRAMRLLAKWSAIARVMPRSAPIGSLSKRERYRRLTAAARMADPQERYSRLTEITPPELVLQFCGEEASTVANPSHASFTTHHSSFRPALFRDQLDYLPGDLLCKVDSAAMAHALEVRAPFLDHSLVEFANALPDDQLIHGGQSKRILREAFAADLPAHILVRPKKGFAVPVGMWFKSTLRGPLHDLLLAQNSFVTTHLRKPVIERMLAEHESVSRDHTHRLFALLMLELWAREFNPVVEP